MLLRAPSLWLSFAIVLSCLAPAALAEPSTPEPVPTALAVLPAPTPSESAELPGTTPTELVGIPMPIPASVMTPPGGRESLPSAPDAWGLWAPNLLDNWNGNAEAGAGATDTSSTVTIPGWTVVQAGMTAVRYGISGMPTAVQNTCGNPGLNFFAGGPNNSQSSIGHDWSLTNPSELADIDTGLATYEIAGCFGGKGTEGDKAWLEVTFNDGAGRQLSAGTAGSVTAADRGFQTKLIYRAKTGRVPAGTRAIHVRLLSQSSVGPYNDGYADNLRLSLRRPSYVYLPLLMRTTSAPPSGNGILRVVNNSAHPIVSLEIDGQQLIFNTATSIGTNSYKDYPVASGSHTCTAYNGFYQTSGLPFTMYGWGCNWTQPAGQTFTLTLNNHTLQQILSYYSTAAYWGSTCLTSNGIDFNECGICFYGNGKYRYLRGPLFSAPTQMSTIQSGTYGNETWGSMLVDFTMAGGGYTHSAYYQDYSPGVYVRAPHSGLPTPMDSAYLRQDNKTCPAAP